jgi:hypothetical protein
VVVTAPAPLPTARVAELDEVAGPTPWLVRSLWSAQAVGFVAGTPKSCKSWLGLDLAISIASNTPCLDRFQVDDPGRSLVFLAEDSLPQVRRRIQGICNHRRLDLDSLDLFVITSPSLRLDSPEDQARLDATVAELRPRLVLLDPLVRLHRIDENSAAETSALLGALRHLQRKHQTAIAVVHHVGKRSHSQLGQALRGSTDLHAWSDSAAYLVRKRDRLELALEHRSAPAPEPFAIELIGDDPAGAHLRVCPDVDATTSSNIPEPPLVDLLRKRLADAREPLPRSTLRRDLRVNNQRLGDALLRLERDGIARRSAQGWALARPHRDSQLALPGS